MPTRRRGKRGAIKLARKYSFDKYGKGRFKVLTLINSFHGRTVTTLKATGQERFHNYFFPFTEALSMQTQTTSKSVRAKADRYDLCHHDGADPG